MSSTSLQTSISSTDNNVQLLRLNADLFCTACNIFRDVVTESLKEQQTGKIRAFHKLKHVLSPENSSSVTFRFQISKHDRKQTPKDYSINVDRKYICLIKISQRRDELGNIYSQKGSSQAITKTMFRNTDLEITLGYKMRYKNQFFTNVQPGDLISFTEQNIFLLYFEMTFLYLQFLSISWSVAQLPFYSASAFICINF